MAVGGRQSIKAARNQGMFVPGLAATKRFIFNLRWPEPGIKQTLSLPKVRPEGRE